MDPAPAKICVFCNQDCSRRPRSKDSRGRYMCNDCLARRRLKAGAIASVEAAAGMYDAERTMTAVDSPDPAPPSVLTLTRPARVPSEDDPIPMPPPEPSPPRPAPVVRPPAPQFGLSGTTEGARSTARHMAVVWVERGAASPADLFEALTGRGIEAVEVSDPYMAVAEICRLFRARRGESGAVMSDKPDGLLALVTVSPEGQPETCSVCEAVGRYASGTPCWMFGPARAPRLRPILDGDLAQWKGAQEPALGAGVRPLTVARPASPTDHAREGTPSTTPAKPEMSRPSPPGSHGGPHLRLAGSERREPEPKPPERNADLNTDGPDRGVESARSRESETGEGDDAGRPPLLSPEELAMLLGDDDGADR